MKITFDLALKEFLKHRTQIHETKWIISDSFKIIVEVELQAVGIYCLLVNGYFFHVK